eukprot:g6713.t1
MVGSAGHFEAMRQKYDEERDKRLRFMRDKGNSQYVAAADLAKVGEGRFGSWMADPWVARSPRPAVTDAVEVAVIGAGFGGLCAGARCRMAGVPASSIRLIDGAGDVGGTWYWNRYPGAQCDVESYCYMPLLEELGVTPTLKYAKQPELLQHSQRIARHYGLYDAALLATEVTSLAWEEEEGAGGGAAWRVRTNRGDDFRARYVITNFGTFTKPKLPRVDLDGLLEFRGKMFHTARWDYSYTGGGPGGAPLERLRGKRVAVVGTGATAVQVVPHLARAAGRLLVFQRTPSSVDVRDQRRTTPAFAREFLSGEGWQRRRMDNFTLMTQTPALGVEDLIQDGWTKIMGNLQQKFLGQRAEAFRAGDDGGAKLVTRLMEEADLEQMDAVRARAERVVHDPATAEALKPYYRQFCKRPCFHDEYLPAFNRDNVALVDTGGAGIERVTARGVVAAGREHEVDCIVWATGFETGYSAAELGPRKVGFEIYGRGGQSLSSKWRDGPRTLNSYNTRGFPNLFMQNAPQGPFTTNFVQQLDEAAVHAAHAIAQARSRGYRAVEPTAEAEDAYCRFVYERSGLGQKFLKRCTPGYYNAEGQIEIGKTLSAAQAPLKFFARMKQLRDEGRVFEGFECTT